MPLTPDDVTFLHENLQNLLQMWMKIRKVFVVSFSGRPITSEQENTYLQLKTEISRVYRGTADRLSKGLHFDGDKMTELLKSAMTMEHLSGHEPDTQRKILASWFSIYIKMTRSLGALETIKTGYYPHQHRELLRITPYKPPREKATKDKAPAAK